MVCFKTQTRTRYTSQNRDNERSLFVSRLGRCRQLHWQGVLTLSGLALAIWFEYLTITRPFAQSASISVCCDRMGLETPCGGDEARAATGELVGSRSSQNFPLLLSRSVSPSPAGARSIPAQPGQPQTKLEHEQEL